jgi:hypothetical protein
MNRDREGADNLPRPEPRHADPIPEKQMVQQPVNTTKGPHIAFCDTPHREHSCSFASRLYLASSLKYSSSVTESL